MRLKTTILKAFGLLFLFASVNFQTAQAALYSQFSIQNGYSPERSVTLPAPDDNNPENSVLSEAANVSGAEENASALPADSAATTVGSSVRSGRTVSPVDTLRMSLWEGLFWKRHGLMRVTGLFPLDKDNSTNDLRQMAKTRRRMLSWHQKLGLLTMGSMALTLVSGQMALCGNNPGFHKTSVRITIGIYSATALFSLASPPKLVPKRGGVDTITFHKWFAALHVVGMIITPLINPSPGLDYQSKARRHQIAGYITFGAFTAGMLTVMLFR